MTLDQNHYLYKFHQSVDWAYIEARFSYFSDNNEKNRFLAALFYLRTMSQCSSEAAVKQWSECPYWRFFCGGEEAIDLREFPYSAGLLDIWSRELSEEGYDVMVRALFRGELRAH
ncbi:hypothetical protein EOL70_29430 [Leucothrix sargassi]|nr:hypothetical protein EOL70_29430 [Leucothrix sargassi]